MPEPMMRSLLRGTGMLIPGDIRSRGNCECCGVPISGPPNVRFCQAGTCQSAARRMRNARSSARARRRKEQRNEN